MLKSSLIHPQILAALARAGHGSRVLICDGHYPASTARGPNTELVNLNLTPGTVSVTEVLRTLLTAIAVEEAFVMDYAKTGPHALAADPPIWAEFTSIMHDAAQALPLQRVERFAFYEAAADPDTCLAIVSGDTRVYANLMLTIGVAR